MDQNKSRLRKYYIIFAISIFMNGYCFLQWDTYPYTVIRYLSLILSGIGPLLLAIPSGLIKNRCLFMKREYLIILFLALLLLLYMCLAGCEFKSAPTLGEIVLIITIVFLLTLSENDRKIILEIVIKTYTIIIFPSLVYFLLYSIGVSLPHSTLLPVQPGKALLGSYYLHFPFGLILVDPYSPLRLCGIFDEPGFVGTVGALLFAAGYNKVNRKWAMLLLFETIMTFSMGAYLLLLVFAIVYAYKKGLIKLSLVLAILYIGFMVFINLRTNNINITALQNRIDITSSIIFKDNRTTKSFDTAFNRFISEGSYPLWFGNGKYAYSNNVAMQGSFSYKCLIYDFGIVGFCLYTGFYIISALRLGRCYANLPFLIVFLVSIYQRPYVFSILFTTIFILGVSTGLPQAKRECNNELS